MADQEIRAVVVTAHGASDVLQVQTRKLGPPAPGQLQVRVAASGVNFVDVYQRQGIYPIPTPFTLGVEGAGEVVAIGSGVTGVQLGQQVAWTGQLGSHADGALIDAAAAVPVPAGVSAELAAAVMLQGMTAHYLVSSTYAVQPGDSVLVHAAAGGVGQLLIQLCKSRGARVVATVGSAEKQAKAQGRGADEVIRYDRYEQSADLAAAVRAANGGRGVSVAYDGVGNSTFDASLASLEPRGMLALFGAASGQVPPFDLQRLNSGGSLYVTRPTLANYVATREELLWRGGEVLRAVADGDLQVEIGGRYPFDEAARAYDDLEGRRTTGKLLITA
jgi:NADPH:quinone reductase